jgi:hypothetical protein
MILWTRTQLSEAVEFYQTLTNCHHEMDPPLPPSKTASVGSVPPVSNIEENIPLQKQGNFYPLFAACCGPLAILMFFLGLPGAYFLPPIHPSLTAEEVVQHYYDHENGIKALVALMSFVGFFYPVYTAGISGQLSRIPGIPKSVIYTQLIGGTLAGLFLTIPAYFFATTVYRLDRPPELTQLLNDLSWIFFAMPFPSLVAQDLAFSYAILQDPRPNPLFPRWLAWVTGALTITFYPVLAVHCVKGGPFAWNGAISFWIAGVGGGFQNFVIAFYLFKAVLRTDYA